MTTVKFVCRLVLPLFLITVVVAAALGGIDAITADRIAEINQEKIRQAIAQVLPDAQIYGQATFEDDTGLVKTVYESDLGYAVEVVPAGFGGGITMMVGVTHEGSVSGVAVVTHTETAGLGAVAGADNSAGQAFRDSFVGLFYPVSVSKDGGEADTVTGATITSRAVAEGVNAALQCVMKEAVS